jgi:hypothetical protein
MLAAAAFTPYPPSAARGAAAAAECPGSVGGFGEDDFVLHTSQSYIRASQPAISPNVAAGLSAAEPEQQEEEEELQEEEDPLCGQPFTTPSQNSKVGCCCACRKQLLRRGSSSSDSYVFIKNSFVTSPVAATCHHVLANISSSCS